jgi:hypothetical protein
MSSVSGDIRLNQKVLALGWPGDRGPFVTLIRQGDGTVPEGPTDM